MLVGCATLASLFPFVGTIVYTIVRPPEYLDDVRERELEMQAAEARLRALDYELCPHCEYEVKADFLRCPSCMRKLKERCAACGKAARSRLAAVPVLRGRDRGRAARRHAAAGAAAAVDDVRGAPWPSAAALARADNRPTGAPQWTGP